MRGTSLPQTPDVPRTSWDVLALVGFMVVVPVNQRLREALACSALSVEEVAERLGVDAKTVQRWTAGRLPQPRSRRALAALLHVEEAHLWPPDDQRDQPAPGGVPELVALYPDRSAVPAALWRDLLDRARERIEILDPGDLRAGGNGPEVLGVLRDKARAGVVVRILCTQPDLATAGLCRELADSPEVQVRVTAVRCTPIHRFDDHLLAQTRINATGNEHAPVLHLRRTPSGVLFDP
ncbi:MAG TPA: hypothetical protein VGG83_25540, partial [Trebonia sp.]